MDLSKIFCEDGDQIHVVQNRVQCSLVNMVTNLWVP
jgi:hypothetical protein